MIKMVKYTTTFHTQSKYCQPIISVIISFFSSEAKHRVSFLIQCSRQPLSMAKHCYMSGILLATYNSSSGLNINTLQAGLSDYFLLYSNSNAASSNNQPPGVLHMCQVHIYLTKIVVTRDKSTCYMRHCFKHFVCANSFYP